MSVFLKEVSVGGKAFRIEVDNNGDFSCLINEERIYEKSLEALTERITKLAKKETKPVPFCRMIPHEEGYAYALVHGVITRRNAANRNLMVKIGKETTQHSHYRMTNDFIRPLNQDEEIIYANLYRNLGAAQKAIDAFEEDRMIDVPKALGEKEKE